MVDGSISCYNQDNKINYFILHRDTLNFKFKGEENWKHETESFFIGALKLGLKFNKFPPESNRPRSLNIEKQISRDLP